GSRRRRFAATTGPASPTAPRGRRPARRLRLPPAGPLRRVPVMSGDAARTEAAPRDATGCRLCGAHEAAPRFEKSGWGFVACRVCGLVALDPMPTAEALAAHHETSYRDGGYAGFAAADAVRSAIAEDRLARLRPLAPAGRWLDVGCSTGAFVAAAVHARLAAEGLEASSVAVDAARARGRVVPPRGVAAVRPPAPLA